ncbi:MAG TPA: hypothetical protein VKA49_05765 [Flavitalea sp.]|nr:hypothetical protein [Flavitalea sp.]
MDNRINILSELQSISPTVAGIAPVNPYKVPQGYFEDLATQILALTKQPSTFLTAGVTNPYTIPEGYFERFPEQILAIVKNDDSFELLKNKPANPYEVPDGYFENLAETILSRVKAQDSVSPKEELESLSPLLSKLDKAVPFTIPDEYFQHLSGNVMAGMKAIDFVNEELENLSPLMDGLRNENVYEVPPNYFAEFPAIVLSRAKEQKPAKVVSMSFGKKVMRYAAAAIVIGIVITAAMLFMNRQSASVTSESIVQVEEKIQSETQNKLKGISDDELLNFMENQASTLPDILNLAAADEIDDKDVQLMLADIPDAELKRYLVEYSDSKEVLTN